MQLHQELTSADVLQYQRRLLSALLGIQIVSGLATGSATVIGGLIAAELGGTAAGGMGATCTTIGAAIFAVPLARVLQRYGRRTAMTTGIALAAGGSLCAISAIHLHSFLVLVLALALLGAASAVNLQARFAAADIAQPEKKARYLSIVVWSTTIGAVAGPNMVPFGAPIGQLVGLDEYSGSYILLLFIQLIAILCTQLGLRPDPAILARAIAADVARASSHEQQGDASSITTSTSVSVPSVAQYPLWLPISFLAIMHFIMVALMSMTAVHMHGHGISIQTIGVTVSLHIFGMYGLSPIFGWCADHFGRVPTMGISAVLNLISALMMVFWSHDPQLMLIALFLLGVGWSAAMVSCSALLGDLSTQVDAETRSKYQGRSDLVMNIVGAIGGLIAGPIVATWGIDVMAIVTVVTIIITVVCSVVGVRNARPQMAG